MQISHFQIQNFRKLVSITIDIAEKTTLFVGANNSGKTSAMVALRQFLVHQKQFTINDFSLEHRAKIMAIGSSWLETSAEAPTLEDISAVLPSLDVWLDVSDGELHYVSSIIPNLSWNGGLVGVRLRYEPKDVVNLWKAFRLATSEAQDTKVAFAQKNSSNQVKLWPENFIAFLSKELRNEFTVRTYVLDPSKVAGLPQSLHPLSEPIEGNPLQDLIRINEIGAQRGFSDEIQDEEIDSGEATDNKRLSVQLRRYYDRHLDPTDRPGIEDLEALQALETAQGAFDARLDDCFKKALSEVRDLGYPGVFDPTIKVSTQINMVDGLKHHSAVQYQVGRSSEPDGSIDLHLPEHYNGLGYQNLISMVFRLLSFRSGWMREGKASKDQSPIKPLHLVLIEEPEAHLHVQVQQVFIKKAYGILRNHDLLKGNRALTTQLIVSTHSSHVAHELDFASLRYFRRLPAMAGTRNVPTSSVVNLTDVFGGQEDTKRFVTRYLRTQHCDLFFADAAILVEGPAEKMLIPNFIRDHYKLLDQSFITLLEIGGSHSHRLRPLIERLGLLTLVITDLDAVDKDTDKAVVPNASSSQETANASLRTWHPSKKLVSDLVSLPSSAKELAGDELYSVRFAYQTSVAIEFAATKGTPIPSTFEDALVLENLTNFENLVGVGLAKKVSDAIKSSASLEVLTESLFTAIRQTTKKAEFALDVLEMPQFSSLIVPSYIEEGLNWLSEKLELRLLTENKTPVSGNSGDE